MEVQIKLNDYDNSDHILVIENCPDNDKNVYLQLGGELVEIVIEDLKLALRKISAK